MDDLKKVSPSISARRECSYAYPMVTDNMRNDIEISWTDIDVVDIRATGLILVISITNCDNVGNSMRFVV